MQISEEKINQFRKIYFKKYGRSIDKNKAIAELTALVCLLDTIYKHINKQNYGK